ncbi:MAG TPA: hypothetical protein VMV23_05620 [Candidatus Nanopelagicaceae bacterium]|nr:hypothetical protein [Candidatus Nanopelagicaceae bacterium]
MNYQDFESAWYLGLMVTSFFVIMLVGFWIVMKRVRQLFREGDEMSAWLTVGASLFTFLFLLGLCLALLVEIVVLGSG